MQYKDTSQQAFIYLCICLFIYLLFGRSREFLIWKVDPPQKKLWVRLLYGIKIKHCNASFFSFPTLFSPALWSPLHLNVWGLVNTEVLLLEKAPVL